jgi:hypothetical protein
MPVDVQAPSSLLFIYFSAGNGGSGTYPAQLIALTVSGHAKDEATFFRI